MARLPPRPAIQHPAPLHVEQQGLACFLWSIACKLLQVGPSLFRMTVSIQLYIAIDKRIEQSKSCAGVLSVRVPFCSECCSAMSKC